MFSSSLPVIRAIWVLPEATLCSMPTLMVNDHRHDSKDSLLGEHPHVVIHGIKTTKARPATSQGHITPPPKLLAIYHLPRGCWLVRTAAPTPPPSTPTESQSR